MWIYRIYYDDAALQWVCLKRNGPAFYRRTLREAIALLPLAHRT